MTTAVAGHNLGPPLEDFGSERSERSGDSRMLMRRALRDISRGCGETSIAVSEAALRLAGAGEKHEAEDAWDFVEIQKERAEKAGEALERAVLALAGMAAVLVEANLALIELAFTDTLESTGPSLGATASVAPKQSAETEQE